MGPAPTRWLSAAWRIQEKHWDTAQTELCYHNGGSSFYRGSEMTHKQHKGKLPQNFQHCSCGGKKVVFSRLNLNCKLWSLMLSFKKLKGKSQNCINFNKNNFRPTLFIICSLFPIIQIFCLNPGVVELIKYCCSKHCAFTFHFYCESKGFKIKSQDWVKPLLWRLNQFSRTCSCLLSQSWQTTSTNMPLPICLSKKTQPT